MNPASWQLDGYLPLVLMHKSTALDMIQGAPKCTISTKRCQMNESVPMLILNEVMLFLLRDSDRQQQHGAICTVNFCPSDCTPGEKGKFGYPLTAFSARRLLAEALGLWKSILCSLVGTGQLPVWALEQTSLPAAAAACPFLALSVLFHPQPF